MNGKTEPARIDLQQKGIVLSGAEAATGEGEFDAHPNSIPPTSTVYGQMQAPFAFFNERLFGGVLPDVIFVMTRAARAYGHFGAEFFESVDGSTAHEISLNPTYLATRSDLWSLSTLVHEMVHLHRHVFGGPNRKGGRGAGGYHEKQWATKMLEIGLVPTDTGEPGGKMTGYAVSHLIVDGGPFDLAARELLISGFRFDWHDSPASVKARAAGGLAGGPEGKAGPAAQKRGKRMRYDCRICGLHAWAKSGAKLICGTCHVPMSPHIPNAVVEISP